MEKTVAVIRGDYSSREFVRETLRVMDRIAEKYGHTFRYVDVAMGGDAIDEMIDDLYHRVKFFGKVLNINKPRVLNLLRKHLKIMAKITIDEGDNNI